MRWVAAERIAGFRYRAHPDSPEFDDVGDLMAWLAERELIRRDPRPEAEGHYIGWGDPWYAVPTHSRNLTMS